MFIFRLSICLLLNVNACTTTKSDIQIIRDLLNARDLSCKYDNDCFIETQYVTCTPSDDKNLPLDQSFGFDYFLSKSESTDIKEELAQRLQRLELDCIVQDVDLSEDETGTEVVYSYQLDKSKVLPESESHPTCRNGKCVSDLKKSLEASAKNLKNNDVNSLPQDNVTVDSQFGSKKKLPTGFEKESDNHCEHSEKSALQDRSISIEHCYEQVYARLPMASGEKTVVYLSINRSGMVQKILLRTNPFGDKAHSSCVINRLKRARFCPRSTRITLRYELIPEFVSVNLPTKYTHIVKKVRKSADWE